MASIIGDLIIRLQADIGGVKEGLGQAGVEVNKFSGKVGDIDKVSMPSVKSMRTLGMAGFMLSGQLSSLGPAAGEASTAIRLVGMAMNAGIGPIGLIIAALGTFVFLIVESTSAIGKSEKELAKYGDDLLALVKTHREYYKEAKESLYLTKMQMEVDLAHAEAKRDDVKDTDNQITLLQRLGTNLKGYVLFQDDATIGENQHSIALANQRANMVKSDVSVIKLKADLAELNKILAEGDKPPEDKKTKPAKIDAETKAWEDYLKKVEKWKISLKEWYALITSGHVKEGGIGERKGVFEIDEEAWDSFWAKASGNVGDFKDGLKGAFDGASMSAKKWGEAVFGYIQQFSGLIAQMFVNWEFSAQKILSFFGSILQQIMAMVIQATILSAIMMMLNPGKGFGSFFKSFLGFQEGGIVPGVKGQPIPAMVHGGEMVLTPEQQQSILNFNPKIEVFNATPETWVRITRNDIRPALHRIERGLL